MQDTEISYPSSAAISAALFFSKRKVTKIMSTWTVVNGNLDFQTHLNLDSFINRVFHVNEKELPTGSEGHINYTLIPIIDPKSQDLMKYRFSISGNLRDFDEFNFDKIGEWLDSLPKMLADSLFEITDEPEEMFEEYIDTAVILAECDEHTTIWHWNHQDKYFVDHVE